MEVGISLVNSFSNGQCGPGDTGMTHKEACTEITSSLVPGTEITSITKVTSHDLTWHNLLQMK